MLGVLETWTVRARNLPEHADNRIHTDAGARAAGFPAALVAGVTTYAYLTHPIVAAWGLDWVANGGGEVRFDAPVFDHDDVTCTPVVDDDDRRRGRHGAVTRRAAGDAARGCEWRTDPRRSRWNPVDVAAGPVG